MDDLGTVSATVRSVRMVMSGRLIARGKPAVRETSRENEA